MLVSDGLGFVVVVVVPLLQVTARVSHPPPLKLQSFDGLVDHSCMEDQEKKGGILSKVTNHIKDNGA